MVFTLLAQLYNYHNSKRVPSSFFKPNLVSTEYLLILKSPSPPYLVFYYL